MISKIAKIFQGDASKKFLSGSRAIVDKINEMEKALEVKTDTEIKEQSLKIKENIRSGQSAESFIVEAFALAREAGKRVMGMRYFDVQLLGGLALYSGNIAEMKTGEGKTFVCTLPAYLQSLSGLGVHIVSVNDYLTKRDFEWMKPLYEFLGISVGCVTDNTSNKEKIENYNKDIVYVNNSTLGFDYLRDNMRYFGDESLFSGKVFNYAIVDEADSILIDEARTPLIISGPAEDSSDLYMALNMVVSHLTSESYDVSEEDNSVNLTGIGTDNVENMLQSSGLMTGGLYDAVNYKIVHHLNQSLRAHKLFARNKQYLIKDQKVMIIDELTGRVLDGRRYSDGLHQAIEAKEGVPIQKENQTLASITYQNLFRMYKKLAGMSGTAKTDEKEFKDIYHVNVVEIPMNRTLAREDFDDLIFVTKGEKNKAVVEKVKELNAIGRPVLVGTASVEYSEELSDVFKKAKIPHEVLNAKNHEKEAKIIANAGKFAAVTIATNMAGRGTDIKLGGSIDSEMEQFVGKKLSPEELAATRKELELQIEENKSRVLKAGGLFVLGAERYESRRVDNQLRGRSGRQGDPGSSQFFLSLEDDLLRIFGGDKIKSMISRLGFKEGEAMNHGMLTKVIRYSQKRIESMNYDMRKSLIRYDDIFNEQRVYIYDRRNSIMESEDIFDNIEILCQDFIEDMSDEFDIKDSSNFMLNNDFVERFKENTNIDLADKGCTLSPSESTMDMVVKFLESKTVEKLNSDIIKHGGETISSVVKNIMLSTLDEAWKAHLSFVSSIREGIHLRSYGQKDPLNEYKMESYKNYDVSIKMINAITLKKILAFEINEYSE
jgi:preprotein translocase subunit SecA